MSNTGSHVCFMPISVPDIPDDEAQYWTGKLEHINTMRIHDEVKCNLIRFYHFYLYEGKPVLQCTVMMNILYVLLV